MTKDIQAESNIRFDAPAVMNLEEAAIYLGFAVPTLRRLIRDRQIPAAKVAGQWRFLKTEIDRWLADLSKQAVSPAGRAVSSSDEGDVS